MNKLILLITIFLLPYYSFGQLSIFGKIENKEVNNLEFITVGLLKDSLIITTTLTDSLGNYQFSNLDAGIYSIKFSYIGFENKKITLVLKKDTVITTQLKNAFNQLSEVVITNKMPLIERKVDRLVFNVENSVSAIGSDGMELLSKTPGVRVQNNNISLIGKAGVNIMIDDKLTRLSGEELANLLKSISADDIARIEVITNPSAKYDAQGNNGLVNIVLKRNKRIGYNGSLNCGYKQSTYSMLLGGGNFNYNKNKIKLYSLFDIGNGAKSPVEQYVAIYPTHLWKEVDNRKDFSDYLYGRIGVDYQVSKNTLFGISYVGDMSKPDIQEDIVTSISKMSQSIDSSITTHAFTNKISKLHTANIHIKQLLDTNGKQVIIDGDWYTYSDKSIRIFDNTSYLGDGQLITNSFTKYLSSSNQGINIYTLKADVDLPYKAISLSCGGKITLINNKNYISFYQWLNSKYEIDTDKSNRFNYKENTQALYTSINKEIKKWHFQLGIRGEYTQTTGTSITNNQSNLNNYFRIFPTVFITYKSSDENTFSINYGKRINRPNYWSLNPFRWYSNPYSYSEGNPFLQPSFNNNIELSHTYLAFLTSSLSFSHISNGYDQVTFTENTSDIQATKYVNYLTSNAYQLSNSISMDKITWLENSYQLQVYYTVSRSSLTQTQPFLKGWGAYFSTDNQIRFNKAKSIFGSLNFWYQFPEVSGMYKSNSYYNLDAGFKILLINKKLQFVLNMSDIFKTNRPVYYSTINNIKQQDNNYYDYRQLKIMVRYQFGNDKIKHEKHESGNMEEQNRVK